MSDPLKDYAKRMDELLEQLNSGKPIEMSPETRRLAEEVVKQQKERENENIEEWAKNLVDSMYNSPGFKDSDY
jgi:hypothetical protein